MNWTSQQASGRTDQAQLRADLTAAFRLTAKLDLHEAVANHFSAALSEDGSRCLINPKWRHFSRLRASDLLVVDFNDPTTMDRPDAPDVTAWCLHGAIHTRLPWARCVLHAHPPHATALACLADPEIKAIDQNTARFFNRVAIDKGYEGMASTAAEGERLVKVMGGRRVLLMGSHGVLIAGPSIAAAFDDLYYLERACRTLILAYSTGQPLNVLSPEAAERTAQEWEVFSDAADAHFSEMRSLLQERNPLYAD